MKQMRHGWTKNAGAVKRADSYKVIGALFEAAHRRTGLSTLSAWALKDSGAYGGTLSDREGETLFTSFTCTLHEFRKAGDNDREVTAEVKSLNWLGHLYLKTSTTSRMVLAPLACIKLTRI